ncbi:DUF3344 domain-containing protein [Streptomyces sp. NPDC087850]|uniref:DUF3344 domain-containing protein n=1 Tax=Streptomyces sp. NPDC087850 TaxID=3365809 RepID=UPI0038009EC1
MFASAAVPLSRVDVRAASHTDARAPGAAPKAPKTAVGAAARADHALAPVPPPAPAPVPTHAGTPLKGAEVTETERIPFARRYYALQHGGIVRAANAAISCRAVAGDAVSACATARAGGDAANQDFDMFYSDVDDDPNTYNSTAAELRVPRGARVSYARLYWGGNLLVGEQKPARDNGRVLIAEQGGSYREILADTVIGHRTSGGADAYQASAEVTDFVRDSGSGTYTVAQINVAMGRSAVGAWGGWTLVVAYQKYDAPLRHLAVWDGFETLDAGSAELRLDFGDMRMPKGATGGLGVVAYDGDRGVTGDALMVETGRAGDARGKVVPHTVLSNNANNPYDAMNSSVSDASSEPMERNPAYVNTLGYDSDVFDLRGALISGGDRLSVRFNTGRDGVWLGVFFVEADAQS